MAHGVGQQRSGQGSGKDEGPDTGARHDRRGVGRELVGLVAGVVADHDASSHGRLVLEVAGQPGRGPANQSPVHAIRARAQLAPQARGAELQVGAEAVGQGDSVARGQQCLDLGSGPGVGILVGPGLGRGSKIVRRAGGIGHG